MQRGIAHPSLSEATREFVRRAHGLLIDGKWSEAQSGRTLDVEDPGTAELLTRVAAGEAADIDRAVQAARQAFDGGPWRRVKPAERARLLWKLADLMHDHADELAQLESLDNGKPVVFARAVDVLSSVEMVRYFAGWTTKFGGETVDVSVPGEWHAYTTREPIGVVGQIVPWNYPLGMAVWKIAPALAAGCTIVLKPAEQTPLTALRLGELVLEAGIPPGVVNVVTGYGETAGAALAAHPQVDKIAFTGSTEVGKLVVQAALGNMKRVSLELGGKSPVIVFPDTDVAKAAPALARAAFFNTGQVCSAGTRLYVHERIYDELVEQVYTEVAGWRIGYGLDADTKMGPLISAEQHARVTGFLEAARADGATVLGGAPSDATRGHFITPAVLKDTLPTMSVVREEIFGPVLCAMSFRDSEIERLAAIANDTNYGLAASIRTRDLSVAHKLARRIKAGSVGVNVHSVPDPALPFGGFRQSGWGRERGREALELYTEVKSVAINLD
ncbi:aldehyde dehydrogenase family protein (plasmid) [Paraburkholderia sp. PREW-6R]|uniref:aldehyde dehydrogenase family protein n=1 Tax=Paraburkholderia sp. PREW-6R TaxID=3141544 RepID=UPI0031F4C7FA